jgi:hypothetical protein
VSRRAHGYLVAGLLCANMAAGLVVYLAFPAKHGLDLQLPRSVAKLETAVGSTPEERDRNRHNVYADFAYLASYTAVFVAAGTLLARQGPRWSRAVGLLAVVTGVATGVLDVLENLTLLRELKPGVDLPELYSRVRGFSIPKWILAAVTNFSLVSLFGCGRWWLTRTFAVVAALAAIASLLTLKRVF